LNPEFKKVIDAIKTPEKYGKLVLAPSYKKGMYDSHAVDCPFLFEHSGRFYMTHIGWDRTGYRTGLASSSDLLHWEKEGIIIDRGPEGSTTEFNIAMIWILRDNDLLGQGRLKKVSGDFLGMYHSYPCPGYESGPAVIGLCWSSDFRHWDIEEPCFIADGGAAWESGGLYKSCLVEYEGMYYMYYNAKNQEKWPWIEQIGLAVSRDLRHWDRYEGNPVIRVGSPGSYDETLLGDPCVLKYGDFWVMFYAAVGGKGANWHARETAAISYDLLHWEKTNEILIDVGSQGSIDSIHAHKPGIIYKNGKLYHFYCAVAPAPQRQIGEVEVEEIRGISVATS